MPRPVFLLILATALGFWPSSGRAAQARISGTGSTILLLAPGASCGQSCRTGSQCAGTQPKAAESAAVPAAIRPDARARQSQASPATTPGNTRAVILGPDAWDTAFWSKASTRTGDIKEIKNALTKEGYTVDQKLKTKRTQPTSPVTIDDFMKSSGAGVLVIVTHGSPDALDMMSFGDAKARDDEYRKLTGYDLKTHKYGKGKAAYTTSELRPEDIRATKKSPILAYDIAITSSVIARWQGDNSLVVIDACYSASSGVAGVFAQHGANDVIAIQGEGFSPDTEGLPTLFERMAGYLGPQAGGTPLSQDPDQTPVKLADPRTRLSTNALKSCQAIKLCGDMVEIPQGGGPMTLAPAVTAIDPGKNQSVSVFGSFDLTVQFDTAMARQGDDPKDGILQVSGCGVNTQSLRWNKGDPAYQLTGTFDAHNPFAGTEMTITVRSGESLAAAASTKNHAMLDGNNGGQAPSDGAVAGGANFVWKISCGCKVKFFSTADRRSSQQADSTCPQYKTVYSGTYSHNYNVTYNSDEPPYNETVHETWSITELSSFAPNPDGSTQETDAFSYAINGQADFMQSGLVDWHCSVNFSTGSPLTRSYPPGYTPEYLDPNPDPSTRVPLEWGFYFDKISVPSDQCSGSDPKFGGGSLDSIDYDISPGSKDFFYSLDTAGVRTEAGHGGFAVPYSSLPYTKHIDLDLSGSRQDPFTASGTDSGDLHLHATITLSRTCDTSCQAPPSASASR